MGAVEAQGPLNFESGHADMVHDVQFDYYGRRIATCSSDKSIRVFDIADQSTPQAELLGHEGPVWQVSWAHPKFGRLLATCGFDCRVIIWKEAQAGVWTQVYNSVLHAASVNSVCFAPHELGLILACGSSDGSITVLSHQADNSWAVSKIDNAHSVGVTGVSWAPATPPGSLVSAQGASAPDKRLASSGCDNAVKVWRWSDAQQAWQQEGQPLMGHGDWVRDVAWAPSLGLPKSTLASAGQDGRALVWAEDAAGAWTSTELIASDAPMWRVSWSVTGNILAVSDSKSSVSLWKEALDGQWQLVSA